MTIMSTYAAQIDGIPLEIETIDDEFVKSIVRHEFPYKDGALLEDMGQTAREISFRAYFWDAADHATYADHIDLLNHLESRELFEFLHPQYGLMQGCVESISVRHDDRLRTAEIDVRFVENMRTALTDVSRADILGSAEGSWLEAITDAIAAVQDEYDALLSTFSAVSGQVKAFEAACEDTISRFDSMYNNMVSKATSIVNAINWGDTFADRVAESFAKYCDRASESFGGDDGDSDVTSYVQSCSDEYTEQQSTVSETIGTGTSSSAIASRTAEVVCGKAYRIISAAHLGLVVADAYETDQGNWAIAKNQDGKSAFSPLGQYLYPDIHAPLMTVQQLEGTLDLVRTMVQNAIDFVRLYDTTPTSAVLKNSTNLGGLKTMIERLTYHVSRTKLDRENLMSVLIDRTIPLHLVCLQYGMDYHVAERLCAVNPQIHFPNFVSGRISVYV